MRERNSFWELGFGIWGLGFGIWDLWKLYLRVPSHHSGPFTHTPVRDQMKAKLLSSYIAYSGPCVVDEAKGSVTLKVEAAWRPDYVGTEQTRYYRFEGNRMLYGPAPNSIRFGDERLTRRLTLERP